MLPYVWEAGLSSDVAKQDQRRRMMAYAGDVSAIRPANVENTEKTYYHAPYNRVAYIVTCYDIAYSEMTLQEYNDIVHWNRSYPILKMHTGAML